MRDAEAEAEEGRYEGEEGKLHFLGRLLGVALVVGS
jgi:hypothetical protein